MTELRPKGLNEGCEAVAVPFLNRLEANCSPGGLDRHDCFFSAGTEDQPKNRILQPVGTTCRSDITSSKGRSMVCDYCTEILEERNEFGVRGDIEAQS